MTVVVGNGLPFWTGNDDWQEMVLGGIRWPGIWTISGSGAVRNLDMKKAKGSDIATLKDEGYKNAALTATGTIWTAAQWKELQALLPEVHPRRYGGDRTPLQLVHPAANFIGVDSVYLRGISIPELDAAKGGPIIVELDFLEWTPAPKPVTKGTGTGTGKGGGKSKAEEAADRAQSDWMDDLEGMTPEERQKALAEGQPTAEDILGI